MKITAVDPFYVRMPEVTRAADGTQDSFLVRVRTDEGLEGWGESDASPLVSLAVYCCPTSHANIINLREILLGETLDGPEDVFRLHAKALRQAMDIQQVHHAYSATDIALWDLVGKKQGKPVYRLLDGDGAVSHPKSPYASVLFGDTPEATREKASGLSKAGWTAAKFGWGPMGKVSAENDIALVRAAREGLGENADLMVDAGVAWGTDDKTAYERSVDFAPFNVRWLEEPLFGDAVEAYGRLAERRPPVPIAAGEGSGRFRDAEDLLEHGGVSYVQIDVGRIGGITPAHRVRKLAQEKGVTYVNHTFKSHLTVAASIHVFAAVKEHFILEHPAEDSPLSVGLTTERLPRVDGKVAAPDRPGLGVEVDLGTVKKYLHPVRIDVAGKPVFEPPAL